MLNYREIGSLPPLIRLSRNGRSIEAHRVEVGVVTVEDRRLRVADAAYAEEFSDLPIRVPRGSHIVYSYQWQHRSQAINVCVAVCFRKKLLSTTRQLAIETDIRPDLTEGVIVDSGEVAVSSSNSVRIASGLGDGYYPVFANMNMGLWLQSVVVDFNIWRVPRVILQPGQEMDEYGFVTSSGGGRV